MAEWLDFQVRLEGHWAWLVLLPLAVGLTFYLYRRTLPAVARPVQWALIGLRGLALAVLLSVLAELVIDTWHKQIVRPLVLVLVDTSTSMTIEEDGARRLERVTAALGRPEFGLALAQAQVEARGFAEAPYLLSLDTLSSLRAGGQATDLARAMRKSLEQVADRENLQGVLLISDGAHNLGEAPDRAAGELGVPVYALGVGKADSPADVRIARAGIAETSYLGRPLSIEAEVQSWGYGGRQVEVLLYEGGQQLGRQRLALQEGTQQVSFEVRPTVPGPHIYRLEIPPLEGEFARDNNETLVFTRALQERLQVLVVAGGPGPDLVFLQRSLEMDSALVVETWVHRQEGRFYQGRVLTGEELAARDVVVLADAGAQLLTGEAGQAFREYVQQGGGLLFIGGIKTWQEGGPPAIIAEVLPALILPGSRFVMQEMPLALGSEGRDHPVVRLSQAEAEADPWAQLPPLPGYLPGVQKREGAVVLVEGGTQERPPLVLAGAAGRGRVIAALSAGFWRLDLLSSGAGGRPQTIRRFWQNAVKWLALQAPAGRVRVSTERHIYRAGEGVVFAAQVFDELLRPQSAATVEISVGEEREIRLQEQGGGQYRGTWSGLEPGEYRYLVRAQVGDALIGTDEGSFIVEQHTVESADLKANPALLEEIARVSGGQYYPLAEWRQLVARLAMQPRLVQESTSLALWGPGWPLGLVVALLAGEWFIRKRSGML